MRGPMNPMRSAVTPVHMRATSGAHIGLPTGMPQPGVNVIGGNFPVSMGYSPSHSPIRRPRSMFKSDYCSTRKFLFFFISLAVDCIDIGANWWIYQEVRDYKSGLVFGSFNPSIVLALYIFSILGTILSILETLNLLSFSCKWYYINPDIALAISLWLEDIPQLGINVNLVYCRERPITKAQYTRAITGIIVVVYKLLVGLSRHCACCGKKFLKYTQTDINEKCAWRSRFISSMMIIGFAVALAEASHVFKYTKYHINQKELQMNVPKQIMDGGWDVNRYFNNVSVYFSPPPIHHHSKMATQPHSEWVRMTSIYEIMSSKVVTFDYSYTEATNDRPATVAFKRGFRSECYIVEPYEMRFNWSDACLDMTNTTIYSIHFTFKYYLDRYMTMGTILYNYAFCEARGFGARKMEARRHHRLIPLYFQSYVRSKWSAFLASRKSHVPQWSFYNRFQHSLQMVSNVWNTGFHQCPPTGHLVPIYDHSLRVNCTDIL